MISDARGGRGLRVLPCAAGVSCYMGIVYISTVSVEHCKGIGSHTIKGGLLRRGLRVLVVMFRMPG